MASSARLTRSGPPGKEREICSPVKERAAGDDGGGGDGEDLGGDGGEVDDGEDVEMEWGGREGAPWSRLGKGEGLRWGAGVRVGRFGPSSLGFGAKGGFDRGGEAGLSVLAGRPLLDDVAAGRGTCWSCVKTR